MISQKTQLSVIVNEKEQTYQCHPQSPLPDVLAGLDQLRSYVYGRIKEAEEAAKAAQEPKPEGQ